MLNVFERSLDLIEPGGNRVSFTVSFGPPYTSGQSYRCPVKFTGWGTSPPDIGGSDSLQALLLAVALVYSILSDFVSHGGCVVYPGTDSEYDLRGFNEIERERI